MKSRFSGVTQSRRALKVHATAAVGILCGAGVAYRASQAHLGQVSGSIILPRGTLAQLPLEIGSWHGAEAPLDPRVIEATDTDDQVSRSYHRSDGSRVSLFVAYGVRSRDLLPHRPEVCYPSAGWTIQESRTVELLGTNGRKFPVQLHAFARGGLEAARLIVLNYYIVDGAYCPDVSLLRSKAWRRTGTSRYVVQVQIVSAPTMEGDPGESAVCAFARESAELIRSLVERAAADIGRDERRRTSGS